MADEPWDELEKDLMDLGSDGENETPTTEETDKSDARESEGMGSTNDLSRPDGIAGTVSLMNAVINAELTPNKSRVLPITPSIYTSMEELSAQETADYYELLNSVGDTDSEEHHFVVALNELTSVVHAEMANFHELAKSAYQEVFPELSTLVTNPVDYARMVSVIGDDLGAIRSVQPQLTEIVANEKVLVVLMAASVSEGAKLGPETKKQLDFACNTIVELDQVLRRSSEFVQARLGRFSPNVSAVVGAITAAQLLIATGSLRQLASTPACNLPSVGIRQLSSGRRVSKVRQQGYIYNSDVLRHLPDDVARSAMRVASAKVVLAARVDLARSDPQGNTGARLRLEVEAQIERLLAPPQHTDEKPLPRPVEAPSKKRGGRRARKYKERFQMTEMRRAQNKMAFGKEEDSYVDAFGEEVGLGLAKTQGLMNKPSGGSLRLSNNMAARLREREVENTFREDMFEDTKRRRVENTKH